MNGRIYLSTSQNDDFSFKMDQVYRFAKLGIQMLRTYDYEDESLYKNDHVIEFDILAMGSNMSLHKFETHATVRLRILDVNEFAPRFVMPQPAFILKDGRPTAHMQRIFTYNVAENRDFSLDVKAVDDDASGTGQLFYNTRHLHPEDTYTVKSSFNSSNGIFTVTVPGR